MTEIASDIRRTSKLSICLAAPGHALLSTSGGTRNLLALAAAMSSRARITVAFRHQLETCEGYDFRVVSLDRAVQPETSPVDDIAWRGLNIPSHFAYLHRLRGYARRAAEEFDVVFEKGWRLAGLMCAECHKSGLPGILLENDLRQGRRPAKDFRTATRRLNQTVSNALSRRYASKAEAVVVESHELKALLIERRGLAPDRITVIELGVDHDLFKERDQASARKELGIDPEAVMLLYVGGMDENHDLVPLLNAVSGLPGSPLVLYCVGDGIYQRTWRKRFADNPAIHFLGPVPHDHVPCFISASDLCVAPYREKAFPRGIPYFSSLKIREYMACGRPVVTIPGGSLARLVVEGTSGWQIPNEQAAWTRFLSRLPHKSQLRRMGHAASWHASRIDWRRTADAYLALAESLVSR